jgi:hypothetical protein
MSSSSTGKAKATNPPPLSFEDTLHDLALIRASDIDLAAILDSTTTTIIPASSPSPSAVTTTAAAVNADVDASVARSHELTQIARTVIKIRNRGDVEAQGERVNDVRAQLEEVVEGLGAGPS